MYLFYNFCTNLHVSNDYFVHHQEFINLLYLQLCTNNPNVPNRSVLQLVPTVRPITLTGKSKFHENRLQKRLTLPEGKLDDSIAYQMTGRL
jgi:hypothetical protein